MFDTHIHLHRLEQSFTPLGSALVPAVRQKEWQSLLHQFADMADVWLALGLHPQYAKDWCERYRLQLQQQLLQPQVVAVGEVGLDARLQLSAEDQEEVFRQQIRLAVAAGKPLILHCYKRYGRLLELLRLESAAQVGGIVHGFSSSAEVAISLHALGFGIGVGRVILSDHARRLIEVVTQVPPEMLVVETDAPWPKHYGEQDWTLVLTQVVARIAQLRGESECTVAKYTERNGYRLLRLSNGCNE